MTVTIPSRAQTAGIPRQHDDVITSADIALITGSEPAVLTEDILAAANLNLPALTVVGLDASGRIVEANSTVEATGTLTLSGVGSVDETITIGSTVYTLKAAPTTVAGQVKIGATAAETALNLIAAINGGAGAGTAYGSLTTAHPDVKASSGGSGVVTITALVGGTAGNSIATTETGAAAAFGAATLANGTATPTNRAIGVLLADLVTGAGGSYKGVPIYRAGCFNPLALKWHASYTSEEEKLNAFRGAPTPTNIIVRRPKTYQV